MTLILTTQVNICQLQDTLDTYFTIPTATFDSPIHGGCDSVVFPMHSAEYSYVCGRAVWYSLYAPISFYCGADKSFTIDRLYLNGLSITHGVPGSRNHIWSYAAECVQGGLLTDLLPPAIPSLTATPQPCRAITGLAMEHNLMPCTAT